MSHYLNVYEQPRNLAFVNLHNMLPIHSYLYIRHIHNLHPTI